jgi:hypothetical protein
MKEFILTSNGQTGQLLVNRLFLGRRPNRKEIESDGARTRSHLRYWQKEILVINEALPS